MDIISVLKLHISTICVQNIIKSNNTFQDMKGCNLKMAAILDFSKT